MQTFGWRVWKAEYLALQDGFGCGWTQTTTEIVAEITHILEIGFLFTQIWYQNIWNLEPEQPVPRIGTSYTCRCSPHHNFQTIMNFKNLFHT